MCGVCRSKRMPVLFLNPNFLVKTMDQEAYYFAQFSSMQYISYNAIIAFKQTNKKLFENSVAIMLVICDKAASPHDPIVSFESPVFNNLLIRNMLSIRSSLCYGTPELRDNRRLVKRILRERPGDYSCVSPRLQADPVIIGLAYRRIEASQYFNPYFWLPTEYKEMEHLVWRAFEYPCFDDVKFRHFPKKFHSVRAIAKKIIDIAATNINDAPIVFKEDVEMLTLVLDTMRVCTTEADNKFKAKIEGMFAKLTIHD